MVVAEKVARIERYKVEITRPEKVLFPDDGITKGDLIDYHCLVAPWMLPYLRERPLALERHPDGINESRIFRKNVSSYYPAWIKTVTVKKVGGTVRHDFQRHATPLKNARRRIGEINVSRKLPQEEKLQ